jgi:hypothetical protein
MTTARNLVASLAFIAFASSALAQQAPAAAASGPMSGGMMGKGCAKAVAKHDHGAERGAPKATAPCTPASKASGMKGKAKHDHAKFHKNQG